MNKPLRSKLRAATYLSGVGFAMSALLSGSVRILAAAVLCIAIVLPYIMDEGKPNE